MLTLVPLLANAGIPMIFITLPAMVIALIPITVIETFVIKRRLGLATWPALRSTAMANAASTIVGIPITWVAVFAVEIGIWSGLSLIPGLDGRWDTPVAQVIGTIFSAAWLAPVGDSGKWAVPLAALILLIPFYLVSVWIERAIIEHTLPLTVSEDPLNGEIDRNRLRVAVRDANRVTYGLLALVAVGWLIQGIAR